MKADLISTNTVYEDLRYRGFGIFPELCTPEIDHQKIGTLVAVRAFEKDKKTNLYCCWCGNFVREIWE